MDYYLLDEALNELNMQKAKVQFAVDYMNDRGILEEGCFTFPDGETVHATQVLNGEISEDAEANDPAASAKEEEDLHL